MKQLSQDVNVHWTRDLSVGNDAMDERNRDMFGELSLAEQMIASVSEPVLADWLRELLTQLDALLDAEEAALAHAGYPELAFHRQLHGRARTRMQACRAQLDKGVTADMLVQLVRDSCAFLTVWLMRHVQDADKLFLPYIDTRYRIA